MKAALQLKDEWEEANWLRLISLSNSALASGKNFFKKSLIAANILLFIAYQALKALGLIVKILLLTEPSLNKIERDETWIFRQIK